MNYDHLKETKTTIKPGSLVLDDHNPRFNNEPLIRNSTTKVIYDGNFNGSALLTFDRDKQVLYTKNELLVLSNFLKDIAETL
mgnify:CR=1 FL=1